ncbi:MAG: cis-prenyltransferase [Thelocarpon superellum]|nr:MAG: cis-prenyltransferase [Thelocarpon superellum]
MSSLHLSRVRSWALSSPPIEWALEQLRELVIGALRQGPIPEHVAFIMDGNRRFAQSHHIERVEGHHLGFEALARILEVCYKSGVRVVTIYAFSVENFKRSKYEVDALMDMAKVKLVQLSQHGDLMDRYGARIRVLGELDMLKPDVRDAIDEAVELTRDNGDAILNVCFPYTSRDEMTSAIRETVAEYSRPSRDASRPWLEGVGARHGSASPSPPTSDVDDSLSSSMTLQPDTPPNNDLRDPASSLFPDPERISAETLDEHMYTSGDPPLDLLIRTSGVDRLSDFMLWQCHQDTDVVFLKCLWPEFDLWNFVPVLLEWQWRRRKMADTGHGITGGVL